MPGADLVRAMQSAAAQFGQIVRPGSVPAIIQVQDAYGLVLFSLSIPAGVGAADPTPVPGRAAEPEPPPVPAGWAFAGGAARFDGVLVPVTGRKLDVLRALAGADGPLSADDLRRAAWANYQAEESSVRWTVGELRKVLRAAFPEFPGDPVPADGGGYTLAVR